MQPQCAKCGSIKNPDKYCQYLLKGKVIGCQEEIKTRAKSTDTGNVKQKLNRQQSKEIQRPQTERHSKLKHDPAFSLPQIRPLNEDSEKEKFKMHLENGKVQNMLTNTLGFHCF